LKIWSPLIAIVDADAAARHGSTIIALASAFLSGGATLLQVRAKNASSGWLLEAATRIVGLAHRVNAAVIINDRADIARMSGADGVHVGQDDLTPSEVRKIVGPDAIVGLSTHTPEQLEAASRGALSAVSPVSYIAIGPVFATDTKATGYNSVGLEAVRRAAMIVAGRKLPLVAIGGITLDTAPDVIRAGASAVAVIGDLVAAGDPSARVRAYLARLTV
jgi:thiamine-phosphate pyrophosphorylase